MAAATVSHQANVPVADEPQEVVAPKTSNGIHTASEVGKVIQAGASQLQMHDSNFSTVLDAWKAQSSSKLIPCMYQDYDKLCEKLKEISTLSGISGLLGCV